MNNTLMDQNSGYNRPRAASLTAVLLVAILLFCSAASAAPTHPVALEYTHTRQLQQLHSLDGTGTTITSVCRSMTYIDGKPQMDYNWNTGHNCFTGGDINVSDGLGSVSTHATSIGGILVGNDPKASHPDFGEFQYLGAAPGATVKISEFWRFISNFTTGGKKVDTDILTMSVGVVFESWWTRRLELLAAQEGTVIVAGIGNGYDVCDPAYFPAAGANVIGVGVIDPIKTALQYVGLEVFSLPRPAHSSCGPTTDGRCGVDIVAPGNCIVPDADSPDGYGVTGSWSSFATPVVAGTAALLTQHAKADKSLAPAVAKDGGNCVMKSILLNSARKLPYWHKGAATTADDHDYSLDFQQGAGALDAIAAFNQLDAGIQGTGNVADMGWDSGTIARRHDSLKFYRFDVDEPAGKVISVTLTWNRHYKTEYPYLADYDADRDLRVELWAVDKDRPGSEVMLDYCDTVDDNIEHIYYKTSDKYRSYEIIVMSNDGPVEGNTSDASISRERYALAWSTTEIPTEKQIEWSDIDGNGTVDMDDLKLLILRADTSPDTKNGYVTGDLNMDGKIDTEDVSELIKEIKG
ncbi:MAG: S8 family serine peptidase [Planctomycetes bacterium]|nr:S8 family serine peptidase [Planctomycetota bacterium]